MNLGQVYTKRNVADFMVGLFSLTSNAKVLDPCFGRGVFIRSLLDNTHFAVEGIEIDNESFNLFNNPNPARCTLKNGDFFDSNGEYDGIIMNPPYVRQEEINELSSLGVTKQKLQSSCELMSISSKANLYMYFILKSILMLRENGELIAIFPDTWTNTPVGKQFREQMNIYGCITELYDVEGSAFEGVPMVDVCIIKYVKGMSGNTINMILRINDAGTIMATPDIGMESKSKNNLINLKRIAKIRRGITTGANRFFISPPISTQDHQVNIISSPKNIKGYSSEHCFLDKLLAIKYGEKITEEETTYLNNCANVIIREGKPLTLKKMINRGLPWYHISIPKPSDIIFSYIIRNSLKFILNEGGHIVRDNFYMISSSYNKYMLLALLNNYYVYEQLEHCGKKYGKGVLKLQKYDIDDIKIPHPDNILQEDKNKLICLSQEIVKTSDVRKIDDITNILAVYYGIKDAKKTYMELKTKRLVNAKNK